MPRREERQPRRPWIVYAITELYDFVEFHTSRYLRRRREAKRLPNARVVPPEQD